MQQTIQVGQCGIQKNKQPRITIQKQKKLLTADTRHKKLFLSIIKINFLHYSFV